MAETTGMEPRISLVTLGVADLQAATKFYQDGLGLPLDDSFAGVSFFRLHGTWLSLYPRSELARDARTSPEGSGFAGFTLAHNVRTREEVDRLLRTAEQAGAKIVKPAEDADWGGYSGYFADLDGYLWEVAWNPHFWIE